MTDLLEYDVHGPRVCRRCGWKLPDEVQGLVMPAGLTRAGFCCPNGMATHHARLVGIKPYAVDTAEKIDLVFARFGHRLDKCQEVPVT